MIAAICLIALIGQDVPPLPASSASSSGTHEVVGSTKDKFVRQSSDEDYWRERVRRETIWMAEDIVPLMREKGSKSPDFSYFFLDQVYKRSLSEALIFKASSIGKMQIIATINPYKRAIENDIIPNDVLSLHLQGESIRIFSFGHAGTLVTLPIENTFLYATRAYN